MAAGEKPVDAPPRGEMELTRVLRRSARMYIGMGVVIVLCGVAIVAKSLLGGAAEASAEIVKYGGTLVAGGSLVPFRMGWSRMERAGSLGILVARWEQVAQSGDPYHEIPELKRIYLKLIRDSLGAKEPA